MIKQGYKFVFGLPNKNIGDPLTSVTICVEAVRENFCSYEIVQRIIGNYLDKVKDWDIRSSISDIAYERMFSSLSKLCAFNGFELVRLEISTNFNRPLRIGREFLTPKKRAELDGVLKQINSFPIIKNKDGQLKNSDKKAKKKLKRKSYLLILAIPTIVSLFGIITIFLTIN